MMLTFGLALALLLGTAGPAHAAFLIPFVAAALSVSTAVASVIVAVGSVALSVGISYVANKYLSPKSKAPPNAVAADPVGGVQLDIRADADVPQSLIVGRAVTAGSLVYAETYGSRGEIDNSDLIEVIALADHPCQEIETVYVEEQEIDLGPEDGGHGFPCGGYNEKLWVRKFIGQDGSADSYAVEKLEDHSERPWTAAMVGRGITYARTHSIYDPELVPGRLRWRFVVKGAKLYDPRKDTTVGGSGVHRFTSLSTHEWTANLAVIAYNILRGIRVNDSGGTPRHFYGLENTPAANMPLDVWFAAMNECDFVVDGKPQFHGGAEIPVSAEPLETVKEILKACDGRLVEIGGVYKLYLGPPGLPVATITDGSLRANEGDEFRPIFPLEQRINYVSATYTRPEDGWLPRVAPPRIDTAAEARDGRRVSTDLNSPWVQNSGHMQRLQKQALARAQRERRHKIPLGPEHWGIEPGDVIEWTSTRNGYTAKLFEIDAGEDDHAFSTTVSMTEVDPDDYDWTAGTDLIAEPDGSLVVERPAPKIITGFSAQGIIHPGTNGTVRPGIRVNWNDPLDGDLVSIEAQYRAAAQPSDIAAASSEDPTSEALIILAGIQSLTEYEVRARFTSFNGFSTEWSLWLPVLTPDARMSLAELDVLFAARMAQLDVAAEASIANALSEQRSLVERVSQLVAGVAGQADALANSVAIASGQRITQTIVDVVSERESRIASILTLNARLDDPAMGLLASATAIDALEASVTTLDGEVTSQGTAITSLDSRLDTAEATNTSQASAISALQTTTTNQGNTLTSHASQLTSLDSRLDTAEADINGVESVNVSQGTAINTLQTLTTNQGNTISSNSNAITALTSRVNTAETDIDGVQSVNSSQATAISSLQTTTTSQGSTLSSHSTELTSLDARLDTAESDIGANASAVSSLSATVTSQGGTISSHTSSLTSLDSRLDTAEANIASIDPAAISTAIDGLTTDVTALDGEVTALSTSFSQVFASNAQGEASAMFRLVAHAAPSGVAARVALEAKTQGGVFDDTDSAAFYLDVVSGIGGRAVIRANRFLVERSGGYTPIVDVSGSTVSLNSNVQINGSLVVSGSISASKIISNAINQTKTARDTGGAINTDGSGSLTDFSTVGSVSITIDSDVTGILIVANMPGHMYPELGLSSSGLAVLQVRFSDGTVLAQQFVRVLGNPSGTQLQVFAPINISAIVEESELPSNGNYTIQMRIASTRPYRWGSDITPNYGPARLGIQAPRR